MSNSRERGAHASQGACAPMAARSPVAPILRSISLLANSSAVIASHAVSAGMGSAAAWRKSSEVGSGAIAPVAAEAAYWA